MVDVHHECARPSALTQIYERQRQDWEELEKYKYDYMAGIRGSVHVDFTHKVKSFETTRRGVSEARINGTRVNGEGQVAVFYEFKTWESRTKRKRNETIERGLQVLTRLEHSSKRVMLKKLPEMVYQILYNQECLQSHETRTTLCGCGYPCRIQLTMNLSNDTGFKYIQTSKPASDHIKQALKLLNMTMEPVVVAKFLASHSGRSQRPRVQARSMQGRGVADWGAYVARLRTAYTMDYAGSDCKGRGWATESGLASEDSGDWNSVSYYTMDYACINGPGWNGRRWANIVAQLNVADSNSSRYDAGEQRDGEISQCVVAADN